MMQCSNTVVSKPNPLSKPRIHALLMQGWTRAVAKLGKGAFTDAIGVSAPAFAKQLNGSMPGFECIDAALDACPTVLDEYMAAKGLKIVDAQAVCDTDDASLLIARLMVKLQEAEHPSSPGGRKIVHTELLGMEAEIRSLHGATGNWLNQIANLRRAA